VFIEYLFFPLVLFFFDDCIIIQLAHESLVVILMMDALILRFFFRDFSLFLEDFTRLLVLLQHLSKLIFFHLPLVLTFYLNKPLAIFIPIFSNTLKYLLVLLGLRLNFFLKHS